MEIKAKDLTHHVEGLRNCFQFMTNDERLELFYMVTEGYCKECGIHTDGRECYCTRDE